jgi:hypothetical protein
MIENKKTAQRVTRPLRRLSTPERKETTTSASKNSTKKLPGKVDAPAIARRWLSLGILPVPLHTKTKRPKGEGNGSATGWNKLRITEELIPRFFQRGDNVGGLWGEPSNWVVDVDLDTAESCVVARHYLPETFVYGRNSAPASHYLYRCEGIATTKYQSKESGTFSEVRSTGSQSVLPPSQHPSGEFYKIYHDTDFAQINRQKLGTLIRVIAAGALAALYYPEKGSRHDFVHALSGALLYNGWKEDDVKKFMKAIGDASSAKEGVQEDRNYTVENTIEHFREGDRVQGWPTLSQWIPGDDLVLLKKWLQIDKYQKEEEPPENVIIEKHVDVEPRLLEVPGLVGEIAKWAHMRSFSNQPLFDLAVGIVSVALASGNKYLVESFDTPLQPYILMLAPTASGKESALEAVFEVARRVNLGTAVFQGFQSYHALLDKLTKPPSIAVWLWDEAARKLKTAAKSQGGQDYQILTYLLSLYGKGNSYIAGLPGRKQAIEPIEHPFFSVLAAAQPGALVESLTETDISLGLINRFMLFDAGEELPLANLQRQLLFPSRIENALLDFVRVKPPEGGSKFLYIRFETGECYRMFTDFNEYARERSQKGGGWEMWGRANQNALILAGTVAIGINPHNPLITERIAQWAHDLIRFCCERWIIRVEQSATRTSIEAGSKHIERLIRNAKEFRYRAYGRPTELRLIERGLMPRSLLIRLSRHLRGKDLEDVIAQLISADMIATREIDGVDTYWVKDAERGRKTDL